MTDAMHKRSTPLVSVVVTAFQKADYISRTLQSVLDQTLEDFEVIVVDDGSTDNTREIIERFLDTDARVRYVYQSNQGPGSARNTGFRHARAELIALLDGDDTWRPDKLETQLHIMRSIPEIDLLFMNIDFRNDLSTASGSKGEFNHHSYILNRYALRSVEAAGKEIFLIEDEEMAAKTLHKNPFILSTALVRKSLWDKLGGFHAELRGPEDLDFWVRAALVGAQFAYSSHIGAVYHKNETSLVRANERTALEQLKHARYAHHSPAYEPIRKETRELLQKRHRQLIAHYAMHRQPGKAWSAFRQSTNDGASLRSFLMALSSIFGPQPMKLYGKARRATVRPK